MLLNAREKIEQCDLAFIPACTHEYYEQVRSRYSSQVEAVKGAPKSMTPVLAAESAEARDFMFNLFASARRG